MSRRPNEALDEEKPDGQSVAQPEIKRIKKADIDLAGTHEYIRTDSSHEVSGLNDVVQGKSGQCFADAALLSMIYANKTYLQSLIRESEQPDWSIVTLFTPDGNPAEYEIENTDFLPPATKRFLFLKQQEHYHHHSSWVSVLLKAYGIHRSELKKSDDNAEEPNDFAQNVLHSGYSSDVFEALTGKKITRLSLNPEDLLRNAEAKTQGLLGEVFQAIKDGLNEHQDDFFVFLKNTFSNHPKLVSLVENNETQFENLKIAYLNDEQQVSIITGLALLGAGDSTNVLIPSDLYFLRDGLIGLGLFATHNIKQYAEFQLQPIPAAGNGHYSPLQTSRFSAIRDAVNSGKFITASSAELPKINASAKDDAHAGETINSGVAALHAYAVLGTCSRTDAEGVTRHFVRLKNPWQSYSAEYDANGLRVVSSDQKGVFTREHELAVQFGRKNHDSTDFSDYHSEMLVNSSGGVFELELADFCQQFDSVTICEPPDEISFRLLHNLKAILELAQRFITNPKVKEKVSALIEVYNDKTLNWTSAEVQALYFFNQIKNLSGLLTPEIIEPNAVAFLDFCATLNRMDIAKLDSENIIRSFSIEVNNAAFNFKKLFGHSEEEIFSEIKRVSFKVSGVNYALLQKIILSNEPNHNKIVHAFNLLNTHAQTTNNLSLKEEIYRLLAEIHQHWESQLYAVTRLINLESRKSYSQKQEFYHRAIKEADKRYIHVQELAAPTPSISAASIAPENTFSSWKKRARLFLGIFAVSAIIFTTLVFTGGAAAPLALIGLKAVSSYNAAAQISIGTAILTAAASALAAVGKFFKTIYQRAVSRKSPARSPETPASDDNDSAADARREIAQEPARRPSADSALDEYKQPLLQPEASSAARPPAASAKLSNSQFTVFGARRIIEDYQAAPTEAPRSLSPRPSGESE